MSLTRAASKQNSYFAAGDDSGSMHGNPYRAFRGGSDVMDAAWELESSLGPGERYGLLHSYSFQNTPRRAFKHVDTAAVFFFGKIALMSLLNRCMYV